MVAAVAGLEPHMAPKAVQAVTVDMARPAAYVAKEAVGSGRTVRARCLR